MFRGLFSQLPKTEEEMREHLDALIHMADAPRHDEIFDHLYGCLSILDSKSSSLLGFNSIIIAVFAIFMTTELSILYASILNIGLVSILTSSLLLLWVLWVHWSNTKDLNDLDRHAFILLTVRRKRTIKYRLSWYFSVVAMLCLSAFILIRLGVQLF